MGCKKSHGHRSRDCCEEQKLQRTVELTTTPTPILIVNEGDGFSRRRSLEIEATVTPTAVGPTVPATASFQLRIDGVLVDEIMKVELLSVDAGVGNADAPSFVIRATGGAAIPVGAGPHEVALMASSDQTVDVSAGGSLTVCAR